MKNAVIAIEDKRFYEHEGVDYRGIARALWQDVLRQSAAQGGSTITQQFVKNALAAQGNRTVFQKLREAALAYHLERKWTKEKILTQYLNTVYFGNGAYGVGVRRAHLLRRRDAPARRHHGQGLRGRRPGGRRRRAPPQAALLAGMIASPTLYDPVENPRTAQAPAQPGARAHARAGDDHERAVRGGASTTPLPSARTSTRRARTRASPTSRPG